MPFPCLHPKKRARHEAGFVEATLGKYQRTYRHEPRNQEPDPPRLLSLRTGPGFATCASRVKHLTDVDPVVIANCECVRVISSNFPVQSAA